MEAASPLADGPAPILRLPEDLQAKCLAHVGAGDRVAASRVCREWKRLVFGSSRLWDRMELWLGPGANGTGEFSRLLEQLRRMGETTTELELLLEHAAPGRAAGACFVTDSSGLPPWIDFDLQQLLAAVPRLRSLRLIHLPSPYDDFHVGRLNARALNLAQLETVSQGCTGLVELGLSPVCNGWGYDELPALLPCLERLPHLRRLLLGLHFPESCSGRTMLQGLSSLVRLEELRCVAQDIYERGTPVAVELPFVSGLVSLKVLELVGMEWHEALVPDLGLSLPAGLTRLSFRAPSWEVLLAKLSVLWLRDLSVWFDCGHVCDLGSVTCLSQLTRLVIAAGSFGRKKKDFGGGLVLPQLQRLTLGWAGRKGRVGKGLPPVVDWTSTGCLTYLCLEAVRYVNSDPIGVDFRGLTRLKTLVLQGRGYDRGLTRFPDSLTGLQLEGYVQEHLPEHLADATGLCSLVLLDCPNLKWRDATFRDTVCGLESLRAFHCCLFAYCPDRATCLGDRLPSTFEAQRAWAAEAEREVCRWMPWLGHGACTVAFERGWNRDGNNRPTACLRRQGDPDELRSVLRMEEEEEAF